MECSNWLVSTYVGKSSSLAYYWYSCVEKLLLDRKVSLITCLRYVPYLLLVEYLTTTRSKHTFKYDKYVLYVRYAKTQDYFSEPFISAVFLQSKFQGVYLRDTLPLCPYHLPVKQLVYASIYLCHKMSLPDNTQLRTVCTTIDFTLSCRRSFN